MAVVQHNTLLTSNLHNPKGIVSDTTSEIITISGTNVGVSQKSPAYKFDVNGTARANSFNVNDAYTLPTSDGNADEVIVTDGSSSTSFKVKVQSVGISGSSGLSDDVILASGSNVTLSQSGNVISISSGGGDFQTAVQTPITPVGDISAIEVQSAIEELDTEKLSLAGGTMSGAIAMGDNNITGLGKIVFPQETAGTNVQVISFLGDSDMGFWQHNDTTQYRLRLKSWDGTEIFMVDNNNIYYSKLSYSPTYVGTIRGKADNSWGTIGTYYRPTNTGHWRLDAGTDGDEFQIQDWTSVNINTNAKIGSYTADHTLILRGQNASASGYSLQFRENDDWSGFEIKHDTSGNALYLNTYAADTPTTRLVIDRNTGLFNYQGSDITTSGTVTSTTFVGALTGNASTATILATARDINGVSFDGSANITVTADANTLSNTTLKSTVVSSSLTSLGTIGSLVVTTADINGGTLDGVQIGGTTATGEMFVNNASDDADGLGSQGDSGQVLTSAGAGANPTWETPDGGADYILLKDEKVANTDGGTFTTGDWRKRDINVEEIDTGGDASIASDQITLLAGTYECIIKCPAQSAGNHVTRLYNTTDAAVELAGSNATSPGVSTIIGRFTIAGTKTFEIQHRCLSTAGTIGFGSALNVGIVEVYTIAEFRKVA